MLPIWLLAAMMIMMYYWRFWEPWANAMLAILLPKLWFGLKIMTGTTVFACLPGAHSPFLDPKKLQNEQFYIIDRTRNNLLVDVANLAPCCLLLLAAAYLLLLTCCSPRLVALGSPPRGDTQGKQKTSIAFLPFRILARSVSFRCQVSTHRRFLISISWGMHKLFAQRRRVLCLWVGAQRAQNLPNSFSPGRTTVPDAMLMSRSQSRAMLC